MNLEKFLTFVTHHNESIIQWLFFGILLLAGTLIARSLFGKKTEEVTAGGDLHSALEKILANTNKLEGVSAERMSAAASPQVEAQLIALKADLGVREKELNELKANGGGNAEAASELSSRIKELESKLAEYEILEDDIADLSLYKEENARLKTELEQMKVVGTPAAAPQVAAETAKDDLQGEDIVAEFAQAVEQKPGAGASSETGKMSVPDTGDPMADFEQTVQLEKKLQGEPIAVKAAPVAVATAGATGPQAEADDLFAEFSHASPEEGDASLDTDKMMAEMAELVGLEPTSESTLEESIDTEKMAAEATSFQKI